MRKPVDQTEDRKLNLRLRQKRASGLLRIVNTSTVFLVLSARKQEAI